MKYLVNFYFWKTSGEIIINQDATRKDSCGSVGVLGLVFFSFIEFLFAIKGKVFCRIDGYPVSKVFHSGM